MLLDRLTPRQPHRLARMAAAEDGAVEPSTTCAGPTTIGMAYALKVGASSRALDSESNHRSIWSMTVLRAARRSMGGGHMASRRTDAQPTLRAWRLRQPLLEPVAAAAAQGPAVPDLAQLRAAFAPAVLVPRGADASLPTLSRVRRVEVNASEPLIPTDVPTQPSNQRATGCQMRAPNY